MFLHCFACMVAIALATACLLDSDDFSNPLAFCIYSHQGLNQQINGKYIYEGKCYNNMPIYRNINRQHIDQSVYIWSFITNNGDRKFLIGRNYTNSSSYYAYCTKSSILNCNSNLYIANIDTSEWVMHPATYLNENCSAPLSDGKYCRLSRNYVDSICVSGAPKNSGYSFIDGTYTLQGCYENEPYFIKHHHVHHNNTEVIYLYHDFDSNDWILDNNLNDSYQSYRYGFCSNSHQLTHYNCSRHWKLRSMNISTNNVQSLRTELCPFDAPSINDTYLISQQTAEIITLAVILPISVLFGIIIYCHKRQKLRDNLHAQKKKSIPMQPIGSRTANIADIQPVNTINDDGCHYTMHWIKNHKFAVIKLLIKIPLEVYDYYTDIKLGKEWLSVYYGLYQHNKCRIDLSYYGTILICCSSIGFVGGFVGIIVGFIYHNKDILWIEILFALIKSGLEDMTTIILVSVVAGNIGFISNPSWHIAYYLSIFTLCCSLSEIEAKLQLIDNKWGKGCKQIIIGLLIICSGIGFLVLITFGLAPPGGNDSGTVGILDIYDSPGPQYAVSVGDDYCYVFEASSVYRADYNDIKVIDGIECDSNDIHNDCKLYCNLWRNNERETILECVVTQNQLLQCEFQVEFGSCYEGICVVGDSNHTVDACFGHLQI